MKRIDFKDLSIESKVMAIYGAIAAVCPSSGLPKMDVSSAMLRGVSNLKEGPIQFSSVHGFVADADANGNLHQVIITYGNKSQAGKAKLVIKFNPMRKGDELTFWEDSTE
jgi:hypothetical protein